MEVSMTEQQKQKIINRLQKVKNLMDRGVEGEAENAARMLGKMLEKHRMSMTDLDFNDEPQDSIARQRHHVAGNHAWTRDLANAVFGYFDCRFAYVPGSHHPDTVVGFTEDIECGLYLYDVAKRQIEESVAKARADGEIKGRSQINNYRVSMVWGFGIKLQELKREISGENQEYGLMVLDRNKQVNDWVNQHCDWNRSRTRRFNRNDTAVQRGKNIKINKGVNGTVRQRRLG
jgi:hypothetical protein